MLEKNKKKFLFNSKPKLRLMDTKSVIEVEEGTTVLVEGFARINLLEGDAEVLGCPLKEVEVKHGRILPVYIKKNAIIELTGNYIEVKGCTIPDSWLKLLEENFSRIFIIGEPDSGKSSLATFILNKSSRINIAADFDIGQANIAHPSAMGFGVVEQKIISLSDVKMQDGFFTGTISPSGNTSRCLMGVKKIAERIGDNGVVIDTTGWIRGRKARDYKLAKIEIMKPDVIACFGEIPYYLSDYNVFSVDSFVVKKRSRELRSSIRGRIYLEWLDGAELREFGHQIIYNTSLFRGERISDELLDELIEAEIVYAEKGFDFLNICIDREIEIGYELLRALKEIYRVEEVNVFTTEQFKGLLVGLYGDRYLGAGLVEEIDIMNRRVSVRTPVKEDVRRVEFGEIRLEDGRDVYAKIP